MLGHRCRRQHPLQARYRSAREARQRARCTEVFEVHNGPEFVSRAILKWLGTANIDTALSDPGKPWQNGSNESFNGKFRDECLSMEWFRNRIDAKIVIDGWHRHYYEVRPHSSLGQLTPIEFKKTLSKPVPDAAISK